METGESVSLNAVSGVSTLGTAVNSTAPNRQLTRIEWIRFTTKPHIIRRIASLELSVNNLYCAKSTYRRTVAFFNAQEETLTDTNRADHADVGIGSQGIIRQDFAVEELGSTS